MSEITRGAIGMPFEMAMESELSRRQFHSIAQALLAERDQLKAENEALLKALDVAAARMLAAKVCFDRDHPGEWSGELHLAVAIKEIDAAMGKGEQS